MTIEKLFVTKEKSKSSFACDVMNKGDDKKIIITPQLYRKPPLDYFHDKSTGQLASSRLYTLFMHIQKQ